MARLFDDAAFDFLEYAGAVLSTTPLSMACWFRPDDAANVGTLMSLKNSSAASNRECFILQSAGTVAGDPVRAIACDSSALGTAATSTGYTADTWHHACGVFASATSRAAYIDGGSKGTNALSRTPSGIDITSIGRQMTITQHFSGSIAEAAIWDAALDDEEVVVLAKAVSPFLVRPGNLVAYWPIWGRAASGIDRVGGFSMTATGTTYIGHPRMIYPSRHRVILPAAAAPPAGNRRRRVLIGAAG